MIEAQDCLFKENTIVIGEAILHYTITTSVDNEDLQFLSDDEKGYWYSEKQYRRNSNDWLASRKAGKQCIKRWAEKEHDLKLEAGFVSIVNYKSGAPFLQWECSNSAPPAVALSLSHKNGIGFFVISGGCSYLGCDVERNVYRSPSCIPFFSTINEYRTWSSRNSDFCDTVSLLWTCKESAIKCLRSSLVEGEVILGNFIITPLDKGSFYFRYGGYYGEGIWWKDENYLFSISWMNT